MKVSQAKVTSKGQITLPAAVRRALGIGTGDRVRFERIEDDPSGALRMRAERTQSRFAAYAGMGNPGIPSGKGAAVRWVRRLRRP